MLSAFSRLFYCFTYSAKCDPKKQSVNQMTLLSFILLTFLLRPSDRFNLNPALKKTVHYCKHQQTRVAIIYSYAVFRQFLLNVLTEDPELTV